MEDIFMSNFFRGLFCTLIINVLYYLYKVLPDNSFYKGLITGMCFGCIPILYLYFDFIVSFDFLRGGGLGIFVGLIIVLCNYMYLYSLDK